VFPSRRSGSIVLVLIVSASKSHLSVSYQRSVSRRGFGVRNVATKRSGLPHSRCSPLAEVYLDHASLIEKHLHDPIPDSHGAACQEGLSVIATYVGTTRYIRQQHPPISFDASNREGPTVADSRGLGLHSAGWHEWRERFVRLRARVKRLWMPADGGSLQRQMERAGASCEIWR